MAILRLASVFCFLAASLWIGMPHAAAAENYRAHWKLNEIDKPRARDWSGNHNVGTNHHIKGDGSAYRFNGRNSRVIVENSRSLNPHFARFSWGVTFSMTEPPSPVGETYDVLRKGLVTTKGGDYKFEVMNIKGKAVARCVSRSFRKNGTHVLATVQGPTNLADGEPHVVMCTKTATSITLHVDSLKPQTKSYPHGLGSVSNTSDLALGAKAGRKPKTGYDWFRGEIYDAWVA